MPTKSEHNWTGAIITPFAGEEDTCFAVYNTFATVICLLKSKTSLR